MGAIIIIFGLYMVLWGKSKDKSQSESGEKALAPEIEDDTNAISETTKAGGETKGKTGEEFV